VFLLCIKADPDSDSPLNFTVHNRMHIEQMEHNREETQLILSGKIFIIDDEQVQC